MSGRMRPLIEIRKGAGCLRVQVIAGPSADGGNRASQKKGQLADHDIFRSCSKLRLGNVLNGKTSLNVVPFTKSYGSSGIP
jgi:hypothetical protein